MKTTMLVTRSPMWVSAQLQHQCVSEQRWSWCVYSQNRFVPSNNVTLHMLYVETLIPYQTKSVIKSASNFVGDCHHVTEYSVVNGRYLQCIWSICVAVYNRHQFLFVKPTFFVKLKQWTLNFALRYPSLAQSRFKHWSRRTRGPMQQTVAQWRCLHPS